jgi:hypothetical protein
MVKKIVAGIAVLSFSFSAVAQNIEGVNARIDAIGGSGAVDDIGWTITQPASLFKFANQFQGSICVSPIPGLGETYGSIIGITALTSNLFVGITMNDRVLMPAGQSTGFYSEGCNLIANTMNQGQPPNGDDNAKQFPNLPTVNVCFKVDDNLAFGLGGFFEGASYSLREIEKFSYTSTTGPDTVLYEHNQIGKKVRNDGGRIEARITVSGITLYPQLKVGFPRISGTDEKKLLPALQNKLPGANSTAPIDVADSTYTFSSKQGLYLKTGSHIWTDIGKTTVLGGVFYTNKRYQFSRASNTNTSTLTNGSEAVVNTVDDSLSPDHNWQMFDWWFAFVPSYVDGLYFSPEYDGGVGFYRGNGPVSPPDQDTTQIVMYHNFRLGIEKMNRNSWIFDEFTWRVGIVAYWFKEIRKIKDMPGISNSDESKAWKSYLWGSDYPYKQAKITAGVGLKKGRATLDVSVDFLKWKGIGIFAGPAVGLATLGVDFGRRK